MLVQVGVGKLVLAALSGTVVLGAGVTAAAATGSLPPPMQSLAATVLTPTGLRVPDPAHTATDDPTQSPTDLTTASPTDEPTEGPGDDAGGDTTAEPTSAVTGHMGDDRSSETAKLHANPNSAVYGDKPHPGTAQPTEASTTDATDATDADADDSDADDGESSGQHTTRARLPKRGPSGSGPGPRG